jgi:transcription termination/antitermination protein NusG
MNEEQKSFKWFVIHAYSGFELKVKQALEERIRIANLSDSFGQIIVPQETVTELVKGERKKTNKRFFPGYVLIQMDLNERTWELVKETPKVSGFLGDQLSPEPLPEEEVQRIISQSEQGASGNVARVNYHQGETVVVTDGAFANFKGTIEEVRPEKGKVRVLISIFGRNTPVELDYAQIERC